MTKDEALKLALEALETCGDDEWHTDDDFGMMQTYDADKVNQAITAIKEALAQPAQEPVAWLLYNGERKESFWMDKGDAYDLEMKPEHRWEPLYTAPQQRPWVGLTDEERYDIREWQRIQEELGPVWSPMMLYLYEAIEAKLKEKNT